MVETQFYLHTFCRKLMAYSPLLVERSADRLTADQQERSAAGGSEVTFSSRTNIMTARPDFAVGTYAVFPAVPSLLKAEPTAPSSRKAAPACATVCWR